MLSKYKLLWLNGALKGRELMLPEGHLSIGPDGDVIAHPDTVDELELLVDENGVHLAKPIPVRVDGKVIKNLDYIPQGKAVELDGIAILLGGADDVLSLDTALDMSRRKYRGIVTLGVICFVTLLLLLGMLLSTGAINNKSPVLTQAQWLNEEIKEEDLGGIKASWSGAGEVTLSGHCRQERQLKGLISNLNNHDITFVDHVQCDDQLVSSVKQILAQHGFADVFVKTDSKPGSIRISGAISAGKKWNKVVRDLERLPGLTVWSVSSQENQQINKLIAVLRKKRLLQGLLIRRVDDTLVVTGKINRVTQKNITAAALATNTDNTDRLKLVFQDIPVNDELTQMLGSPVSSFGGSTSFPFVELEDGTRLTTGSKAANGYRVSHMDREGLDLIRSGEVVHIPLII